MSFTMGAGSLRQRLRRGHASFLTIYVECVLSPFFFFITKEGRVVLVMFQGPFHDEVGKLGAQESQVYRSVPSLHFW